MVLNLKMTKFSFLQKNQITAIYEVSSKDDLVNNFTPDAFKELVELPDSAKEGQFFVDNNLSEAPTPQSMRTAEEIKTDDDWAKAADVDAKWQLVLKFDKGITSLEEQYKDDAAGLEAVRVQFYKENS